MTTRSRAAYKMTNFRGFSVAIETGTMAKPITKQTKAAKLHPPKISSRSHLLTVDARICQYRS